MGRKLWKTLRGFQHSRRYSHDTMRPYETIPKPHLSSHYSNTSKHGIFGSFRKMGNLKAFYVVYSYMILKYFSHVII